MSYVLITPVKDEEAYIEATLKSVVAQTVRPQEWVIVSDGSTDGTDAIIQPYAERYPFIHFVRHTQSEARDFASQVFTINVGLDHLNDTSYAYIGFLDGDIRLDPTYYESMLSHFREDPSLGLAGGALYQKRGDTFVDQRISDDSVAGGVQLFRRACFDAIGGYIPMPRGGFDSVAEVMARMQGWKTKTFSATPFYHLKPMNAKSGSFCHAKWQMGERDYLIGNDPLFELFRCAYRISERPYLISSIFRLLGYYTLWFKHSKRPIPSNVVRFKHAEQRARLKSLFSRRGNTVSAAVEDTGAVYPPRGARLMTRKPILMIVYKYFHEDPRPQREAAALVRQGYRVDVICPHPSRGPYLQRDHMRFFGPVMHRKRGSKLRYMLEYSAFLTYVFVMSAWLQIRNRYPLVQVFVMPEVLMLGALIPKLLGATVFMDWEDPAREVYLAKFEGKTGGWPLTLIGFFERIAVAIADRIIVPNIGFTNAFVRRGIPVDKIDVVMNGTDNALFQWTQAPPRSRDDQGRFVIFYNGSIIPRHGLLLLIQAMERLVAQAQDNPPLLLRIVGHGEADYIDRCRQRIRKSGLDPHTEWLEHVNIQDMPGLVANASVGVIPNLENAFTRINFPQRIFEFAALKKPLVIAKMEGIEDYLSDEDVAFFAPGDADDLAAKLHELQQSEAHYKTLAENVQQTCAKLTWEDTYLDIVGQLVHD